VPTGRGPGGAGESGVGPAGLNADDGQAGSDGDGASPSFASSGTDPELNPGGVGAPELGAPG